MENGRRDRLTRPCVVPAGLGLLLDDLGLSERLAREGVSARGLSEPGSRLSIEEYFALWDTLAAATDQATLGIQLGARYPEHVLEPAFLACLGSRDLREALGRLARYKRTLCPEVLSLTRRRSRVEVHYDWPTARREPPPILIDAELSFLLHLARRATRQPLRGARVGLTHPAGDPSPYAAALDAEVRLGSPVGTLSVPAADLALPFATFNASLLEMLDPALQAQHYADSAAITDVVAAARTVLRRRLGDKDVSLRLVASELGLSARTLQRQLGGAGTSFAALLRDTRRDRAVFYLQQSNLSMSEIAFLLGFDTPSSFFRAFARWTGKTPRAFRNSASIPTP